MNNILNITFEEGKIIAKAGGLWQWDRGQKIRIFGTGIKQDAEMHLSLMEKGGNSVTLRGVYDSNLDALIADIPDRYLGQDSLIDYKLYAFIYVRSDESSAETVYKIILNIKARPKPEGYDDDEGYIIKSGVGESTTGQNVTYSGTDYECGAGAERFNDYDSNLAVGVYSHAEGYQTVAIGTQGHAEGVQTKSLGNYSHAEGSGCEAQGQASHAEGSGTKATGDISHSEGGGTTASGIQSHAEGSGTIASGVNSHAEGGGTKASNFDAHAEGGGTTASGQDSHAEGNGTKATGYNTHAEGKETEAIGNNSHAEGYKTKTTGEQSHAEGSQTKATAYNAHAEGANTEARGSYAHAEGASTLAGGDASHAEGAVTHANGSYSHTEGTGTSASSSNQHAQGKYNVDDQYGKYADIVGIGTADDARANGETTDWTGVKWLKTDVRCGGNNMDDPSAISLVALANMITALETRVAALEGGS